MTQHQRLLRLLQRTDVTKRRAERFGIGNIRKQASVLREKGYRVENVDKETYRLIRTGDT